MIAINPISGERIYLSSLDANGEFSHYVNWLNDPSVNSMLESRHQKHSFESVKEFVNNSNKSIAEYLFGIFLTSTNIHIGNIRLHSINFENRFGEIGLLIGETNEWGKGYATEAISLILEFGNKELGLKTFGAGCYATNLASAKAFQKAGFFVEKEITPGSGLETGFPEATLRLKREINEL
jgi:ribosomal-protein-alanine N-acetyltransferase